ncbi:Hypothetical predicted protein [Pelobates cultripes]|uniref:Uncharacterized protein n=1 Tax=Pelobates cultripes TaxID=61616 RepID=A0AAD1RZA7_PELCU|nr:Hypothetical predicted protein [Pelobates cultripes]
MARDISKLLTGTPIPEVPERVDKEASMDLSDKEASPPQARLTKPTPSGSSAPREALASISSAKQDIADLYDCIRTLFDSDIALVKEEVHAVTERVRVIEEEVAGLKQGLIALEKKVHALQSLKATTNHKVDAMDDRGRRKNPKIRGVSVLV